MTNKTKRKTITSYFHRKTITSLFEL